MTVRRDRLESIYPSRLWIEAPGTLGPAHDGSKRSLGTYPLCALFAYRSNADDRDEFERLEAESPGGVAAVQLLGILNKGVWWREPDGTTRRRRSDDIGQNAGLFLRLLRAYRASETDVLSLLPNIADLVAKDPNRFARMLAPKAPHVGRSQR